MAIGQILASEYFLTPRDGLAPLLTSHQNWLIIGFTELAIKVFSHYKFTPWKSEIFYFPCPKNR